MRDEHSFRRGVRDLLKDKNRYYFLLLMQSVPNPNRFLLSQHQNKESQKSPSAHITPFTPLTPPLPCYPFLLSDPVTA